MADGSSSLSEQSADAPLTIEQLREKHPRISPLLLNGFQGSSFPISESDFEAVLEEIGLALDTLPLQFEADETNADALSRAWNELRSAAPIVKEHLSRRIERGRVGEQIKAGNGYRCQICDGLGRPSIGFIKPDGVPYVEAHHVVPVATLSVGTLAHDNVITVCANHHRELHFRGVAVTDSGRDFEFTMTNHKITIKKFRFGDSSVEALKEG